MISRDELDRMPKATPAEHNAYMAAVISNGHEAAVNAAREWLQSGKPQPSHTESPWPAHIWAEAEALLAIEERAVNKMFAEYDCYRI